MYPVSDGTSSPKMNGLRSRMMAMQAQSAATNHSTGRDTDSKLPLRYAFTASKLLLQNKDWNGTKKTEILKNISKKKIQKILKSILPGRELNPGLARDRRGYLPLYYRGWWGAVSNGCPSEGIKNMGRGEQKQYITNLLKIYKIHLLDFW